MLHRLSRLRGFHIHATDGQIGHIDDVVVDDTWMIRYLVVDTSNFIGGKWVVIAPEVIRRIEWGKLRLDVALTREQIRNGPTLDSLDVPATDKMPTHAFIF